MKKHFYPSLLSLFAIAFLLLPMSGCDKDNAKLYAVYTPVYSSRAAALAAINGDPAQKMEGAGKFYVLGSYIFISDPDKGIHVYDNRNPARPVQTAFLSIPGNQDIAIKGTTLYADMYDDLLAIDISDLHHVKITSRLENIFTSRTYVNGYKVSGNGIGEDSILTGWTKKMVKDPVPPCMCPALFPAGYLLSSSSTKGAAGSMAKMILLNDHMYALTDQQGLQIFDLTNAAQPTPVNKITAGSSLETIYPFEDKLFIGSMVGLYIYDVSNPATPVKKGSLVHWKTCDPVVADGDYAYVTLHSGTACGEDLNQLQIINVKDLQNPVLEKVYPLSKPTGLSKDGNFLFVCDEGGVKAYNAANPTNLTYIKTLMAGNPYDVIASDKRLLVSSDKGIYQYDYSKPAMPLLSFLPVVGKTND